MKTKTLSWRYRLLPLLSGVLLSIPWLIPHCGYLVLFALVPLLVAEYKATESGAKGFMWRHYACFVLWNALTTFWVCNATLAGGIFAILANALQMSLIFGVFRLARRKIGGALPYVLLAALWIAWERRYLVSGQISWPWLVLGNAFARSTRLVQWYSITGTLGGSLWVWCANLGIFALWRLSSGGGWRKLTAAAKGAAVSALVLLFAGLPLCSFIMYSSYKESTEGSVEVVIGQPNLDPYKKFTSMSQREQNAILLRLYDSELASGCAPDLLLAPETFCSDVILNDVEQSPTVRRFRQYLADKPNTSLLFGAATNEIFHTRSAPGLLSYPWNDGWRVSRNSALMLTAEGAPEIFHKSKLVVGTELTPYPEIFVPFDNFLGKLLGTGPLMARDVGHDGITLMHLSDGTPLGCAICYESVYGEYCTGYVKEGARFLAVITNDSWWGNTPGYKQHLSYSSLRAIELRRDIARCGNSGISCFINGRGDVLGAGPWWEEAVLRGRVNLNSATTFFVRHGDVTGRVCVLAALLLCALLLVRILLPKK
ncbi:MAG: apolipoprotein N-acyltransferase [Bacteroidales bacterium]|nr:apolipoprotein N-acyltransferase [Bacteroidales bacterium]